MEEMRTDEISGHRARVSIAVGLLALSSVGLLYGTRETLVRKCEIAGCPREVFRETAFLHHVAEARLRMQAAEAWCPTHAAEPVPYTRTTFCRICGRAIGSIELSAPRRDRHPDEQDHGGLCGQNSCRLAAAYDEVTSDVGSLIDRAAGGAARATIGALQELMKK